MSPVHIFDEMPGLTIKSQKEDNPFASLLGLTVPPLFSLYGDSLTAGDPAGSDTSRPGSYQVRAIAFLDGKARVENYGLGGRSLQGYNDVDVSFTANNPDVVHIALGANDLTDDPTHTGLSWSGATETTVKGKLDTIIANTLAIPSVKYVLLTDLLPLKNKSYIDVATLNAYCAELAAGDSRIVYAPIFGSLYDPADTAYSLDGTHLTQEAADLCGRAMAEWLRPFSVNWVNINDLRAIAGSTGRKFTTTPTVPFVSQMSGDAATSEVVVTDGAPDGADSVNVTYGPVNGSPSMWWKASSSGSFANRWFMQIVRIKSNNVATPNGRTLSLGIYSSDQSLNTTFEGQFDSDGWMTILSFRKAGPAATTYNFRCIAFERNSTDTAAVASFEIAYVEMYDVAEFETATGADFNLP